MVELLLIVFLLGIKHSLDLDHIATIDYFSYISSQDRKIKKNFKYLNGFSFALGHCITVAILNISILFFFKSFSNSEVYETTIGFLRLLILSYLVVKISSSLKNFTNKENFNSRFQLNSKKYSFIRRFENTKYLLSSLIIGIAFALEFDATSELIALIMPNYHIDKIMILIYTLVFFSLGMISVDSLNGLIMSKIYIASFKNGKDKLVLFKHYRNKLVKGALYFYLVLFIVMLLVTLIEFLSKIFRNYSLLNKLHDIESIVLSPYLGLICFLMISIYYIVLYRNLSSYNSKL